MMSESAMPRLHNQRYLWYFHVEKAVHLLSLTSSLILKKSSFCCEFIVQT